MANGKFDAFRPNPWVLFKIEFTTKAHFMVFEDEDCLIYGVKSHKASSYIGFWIILFFKNITKHMLVVIHNRERGGNFLLWRTLNVDLDPFS